MMVLWHTAPGVAASARFGEPIICELEIKTCWDCLRKMRAALARAIYIIILLSLFELFPQANGQVSSPLKPAGF